MSLLEGLRAQPDLAESAPPWALVQRMLPKLVPSATVRKMSVFNTGAVHIDGTAPLARSGRFYYAAVLEVGFGSDPREIRLGVSRYRDEAAMRVIDAPVRVLIEPEPGAVVAWLAGTMLSRGIMDLMSGGKR